MASRALRGGRESAVDEGASHLLASKIAGVFQRAATWARGASEVAARGQRRSQILGLGRRDLPGGAERRALERVPGHLIHVILGRDPSGVWAAA